MLTAARRYPLITNINDVLPAIEGRDEFIVAERDGYTVINYAVAFADTFVIDPEDTVMNYSGHLPKGLIRRECRGLIFDDKGHILSRPFHKFFNLNEKEETQFHNMTLPETFTYQRKMDGSMIRPLKIGADIHWATKMGITDTAEKVNDLGLLQDPGFASAIHGIVEDGWTPLFEFVAPNNRIVVKYEQPALVLLAVRNNLNGSYMSHVELTDVAAALSTDFHVTKPVEQMHRSSAEWQDFMDEALAEEGSEGYIVHFNEHWVKQKNPWYVTIHKAKDEISSDRHIIKKILEGNIDDIVPFLDDDDIQYINDLETDLRESVSRRKAVLDKTFAEIMQESGGDRRTIATVVLPKLKLDKLTQGFMFKMLDGKDSTTLLWDYVKSKLGRNIQFEELHAWLGMTVTRD